MWKPVPLWVRQVQDLFCFSRKEREGKGREGKGREGKGREGKVERKGKAGKEERQGRRTRGGENKGREGEGRGREGRRLILSTRVVLASHRTFVAVCLVVRVTRSTYL